MTVEVLYFAGCPNAPPAIALAHRCAARLGGDIAVIEREGDYPSPTILVNGIDVMSPAARAMVRSCRLDVPTEDRLIAALRQAAARGA